MQEMEDAKKNKTQEMQGTESARKYDCCCHVTRVKWHYNND